MATKLDFLRISEESPKRGVIEIKPHFLIKNSSKHLMIRGSDFYAIWLEDEHRWSTHEQDALDLIDRMLDEYYEEHKDRFINSIVSIKHITDASTKVIDSWLRYVKKQMRDNYHMLDEQLIFANTPVKRENFSSKTLPYSLEAGDFSAWDRLVSVLYSPTERHKIEWCIGSIVSGESRELQKFAVLYGSAGTGKGTILNVVEKLFGPYLTTFEAKALGTSSNQFALEPFKNNPLVAIDYDGNLSRIEDNTRLNALISHEPLTVNEKFKSTYTTRFKSFLFMGTNNPVKITDAKSGILRRLIDIHPSGKKIPKSEYNKLKKQIDFELGAIAQHCLSNDFYNFVDDHFLVFKRDDSTTLRVAWEMYRKWVDSAMIVHPFNQRTFKEELKNYFWEFKDRFMNEDGSRGRSGYFGFRVDRFEERAASTDVEEQNTDSWLIFKDQPSVIDDILKDCPAQYASKAGTPKIKWSENKSRLLDIDTGKLHYVKVPINHIVIDFDIPGEDGSKNFDRNFEAASKWPKTYAELSKSGSGIHLHYIYEGDPSELARVYSEHVEIKVFAGDSSLRRKLSKCNDILPAKISSGLPKREVKKVVNDQVIKTEKGLRKLIERNLNKEIHPSTKSSIDFIYKILEDAYEQGLKYDVSDMHNDILDFAGNSHNQSEYCVRLVTKMKFKSEDGSEPIESDGSIVFFDVEVLPNLFIVCWKYLGKDQPVTAMINPTPDQVAGLCKYRIIGFNNRKYDNHILYARIMGYTNEQLYRLSKRIIAKAKDAMIREAYNLSYTDIYDYAATKMSLKKWEIKLGIHHQELGLSWDDPVPEDKWQMVADYCKNDVIATEAVWNETQPDFVAREILADLAGGTVNDTTNSLTTKIIFGKERKPQASFNYRNMGDIPPAEECYSFTEPGLYQSVPADLYLTPDFTFSDNSHYNVFDHKYKRPWFPGYTFDGWKSQYRGEDPKEGGYVYAEPGIYWLVALLDIASMHPSSIIDEQLFGEYTARFEDIKMARVYIKHKDFKSASTMLDGALAPYLKDESKAADLAQALKIAINSVYGLTSASFENPFRDERNVDNIVAKRGALFMINLKHEVQDRGYTVAHIKTDSIKIPNADPDIIKFVMDYGHEYGYDFEHEATYEKMCLVNDAVYIAKYASHEKCNELYGYIPDKNNKKAGKWDATGTQFAVPYVFKTLFSKEPIKFSDLCETKSVQTELYLDYNEDLPNVEKLEKELAKLETQYKKGEISDTIFEPEASALAKDISKGHDYRFVGKVGLFCPIVEGAGGARLMRRQGEKYYAVTGTKGYMWLEAERVKTCGLQDSIDVSYYKKLVDDAVDVISKYGDAEEFCA